MIERSMKENLFMTEHALAFLALLKTFHVVAERSVMDRLSGYEQTLKKYTDRSLITLPCNVFIPSPLFEVLHSAAHFNLS